MGLGKSNINVSVNHNVSRHSNRSGDTAGSLSTSFLSESKLNSVRLQESRESTLVPEQLTNSPRVRFVGQSNNNETLLTIDEVIFIIDSAYGVTMILPDVSAMQGKEMKFINAYNNYENYFNIQGPYYNENSYYSLTQFGQTVTLISNGSHWFVLNSYNP